MSVIEHISRTILKTSQKLIIIIIIIADFIVRLLQKQEHRHITKVHDVW